MAAPLPAIDTSGLLTILALAAAVWAVVPATTKLRFRLSMTPWDWLVIVGLVGSVHYLVFETILRNVGLYYSFGPWRWGFDKNSTIYSLLFALAAYLLFRTRSPKLARRNLHLFEALFSTHLTMRRYDELAELLKDQAKHVLTIASQPTFRVRLATWLEPKPAFTIEALLNNEVPQAPGWFGRWCNKARTKLAKRARGENEADVKAMRMLQLLLNAPHLVNHLAVYHPHLCLQILEHPRALRSDFCELFIQAQLADARSQLYHELKHNDNQCGTGHRLHLQAENELLRFFFRDVTVAGKLQVYRPVGEAVCQRIDFDAQLAAAYNGPLGYYPEIGKHQCPIYSGIRLFEIMIHEAIHQGLEDHLWLHYLPIFTDKILKQIRAPLPQDQEHEFPSVFHYLVYSMVSLCADWVEEAENVSAPGEPTVERDQFVSEQAASALGNLIMHVIEASLDERFKAYMLEIVLCRLASFQHTVSMKALAHTLETAIIQGNAFTAKASYRRELLRQYRSLDHVLRDRLKHFEAALHQAVKNDQRA
jgi:hypothetical protein